MTDMKSRYLVYLLIITTFALFSCNDNEKKSEMNIIFLHHSTGGVIWQGEKPSLVTRVVRKISPGLAETLGQAKLPILFKEYNQEHNRNYKITQKIFPKASPYGWHNYPFDYYNIWVKNSGNLHYMEEPTLEILTKDYQVIIFKHCFPVGRIQADNDTADIDSYLKSLSNYKLQYNALRDKLLSFPETKFIVWTGAALAKGATTEDEAIRAREFFTWVREEWDMPGDNIHLWDFYELETEGGLYLKDEYSTSSIDSHPNSKFASRVAGMLFNRIIDVIETNGTDTDITGVKK